MELSRNKEHFLIMTVLYNEIMDYTYGDRTSFRDARDLLIETSGLSFKEISPFVFKMIEASMNNYGMIVDAFIPNLVNWSWDRIPLLTQAILIMSYAQYKFVEEIDKKIVINNAVSLTKKYVEPKQAKFVNAILEKVLS